MTAVLTAAATLRCAHSAPLVLTTSREKFTVDSQNLLARADLLAAKILTCPNNPPCDSVDSIDKGLSATLFVDDEPVVLASAAGATAAAGVKSATWLVVSVNQTKLEAT